MVEHFGVHPLPRKGCGVQARVGAGHEGPCQLPIHPERQAQTTDAFQRSALVLSLPVDISVINAEQGWTVVPCFKSTKLNGIKSLTP